MRWLKRTISLMLALAAVALALTTAFGNHSGDYGKVPLPQGGVVHLPQGKVTVFYSEAGSTSDSAGASAPLGFQVVSAGGGVPVPVSSAGGSDSAVGVQRSEVIGELGAVASLQVPSAGDYAVSGSTGLPAGTSSLEFGTNAGAALIHRWRLLVGLLVAAMLIALIPVPRPKRRWEDDAGTPTGWSSSRRAPYAG